MQYIKHLKARYKIDIFPSYFSKHPTRFQHKANQYIKLALVKNQKANKNEMEQAQSLLLKTKGKVKEICEEQGDLTMEDLGKLPDGSTPLRILLQGAPGVGKTTFAWEMCRQWEAGKILQQFSIVMVLCFRHSDVIHAKTIEDLINHPRQEVKKAVCDHLICECGSGVLIICEGYDEAMQEVMVKEHPIQKIINKSVLPHSTVMVTTRPVAIEQLPSDFVSSVDQHVEILGFTSKEIDAYVQSACRDQPDLLKDFRSYLSQHPFAASVMYIPLQCCVITELYASQWERGGKHFAPKTLTELYAALVHTLLLRYLSENNQRIPNIKTLSDLPKCVYDELMQLAKLAAKGIEDHRYVFSQIPGNTMGLMHKEEGAHVAEGVSQSYSFLHLTLQEFLAALYFSQQSSQELVELMKKPDLFPIKVLVQEGIHHEKESIIYHWPVLMFIAGLTQLKEIPSEVFTSLFTFDTKTRYRQRHELSSSLCQVLFEAQHFELVALTFGHGKFCPHLMTSFDAFALAYTIRHSSSTALWVIVCKKFEHLEMLMEGLKCFPYKDHSGRINAIALSGENFAPYINMLPQFSLFTEEVIHVQLIGELLIGQGKDCAKKLQRIHTYFPKLEMLAVKSSSESLFWPIVASLSRMKNLREVSLVMPTADIHTPLPEQHIPTLTKLDLYHHFRYYTPLIIPNAQNLEKLFLWKCHFSGDELTSLLHVLQHLTKLQELTLRKSTIEDIHQVAIAISNSKSLKEVYLKNNNFQLAGAQKIAKILPQSTTIRFLYFYDTTMGYEGAKLLCQEMINSSIQELVLPREYCEWMKENYPHLTPLDRVFIADSP